MLVKTPSLILLVLLNLLVAQKPEKVLCEGLGEQLLWERDTQILTGNGPNNVLFQEMNLSREEKDKLNYPVEKLRIEVVAPSSNLVRMMSMISTKTKTMFLKDYDFYFKKLQIGSTSRPMLLSYLGLQYATQDQINLWYKPYRKNLKKNIVSSCRGLISTRKQSISSYLNDEDLKSLDRTILQLKNKYYLGLLTFERNYRLFMLDSYILLCSKLESESLREHLKDIKLVI